ncbi:hypothetical protein METBIDRAFT_31278 [Metschnikowia bicuspidata var. bicuspidata NRRL YB-4993]|uniref:Uncharacterized protein n=1 Tax=Metschnikowia bicuspidata var. bicuspidata NRRL YB-4993 TaxID=869754 RepID=A0A1A0HEN2_9ASCO|nr:hypothetical protein METBIDRAFT_31278 [Metschnikowia bicuspidata var. bicuspidata NRRL YB-4993]OBA22368.1 hypothetical protein METBIDRAFT_31278 [Metschnikowia bicuspidata var. bicuspidata NRRL YB-4993]
MAPASLLKPTLASESALLFLPAQLSVSAPNCCGGAALYNLMFQMRAFPDPMREACSRPMNHFVTKKGKQIQRVLPSGF